MNFNYNQAIRQASEIDSIAGDISRAASNQFQSVLDSIGVSWQGATSMQFIGYCSETQDNMKKQASYLHDIAARIRDVAKIIKEAEEAALELMRRQAEAKAAADAAARAAAAAVEAASKASASKTPAPSAVSKSSASSSASTASKATPTPTPTPTKTSPTPSTSSSTSKTTSSSTSAAKTPAPATTKTNTK
jgi:uncharacterized protein YukE